MKIDQIFVLLLGTLTTIVLALGQWWMIRRFMSFHSEGMGEGFAEGDLGVAPTIPLRTKQVESKETVSKPSSVFLWDAEGRAAKYYEDGTYEKSYQGEAVAYSPVIGARVVNLKGENLGDVKAVVIDQGTGRVAYAVVSYRGFLGMGEKLVAIRFSSFQYDTTKNEYVVDISKERLMAAPEFDSDHWPVVFDEKRNRDVYK